MKVLSFILFLLIGSSSFSQIKFETLMMDNGMRYPKAIVSADPAVQDSINKIIEEHVADLRSQDFCAGDFGFVQKGKFVQVLLLCNCIDMEKSEHRYLTFNFKEGTLVPAHDIFDPNKKGEALKFIVAKASQYKSSNEECNTAFSSVAKASTFDEFDIRFAADGIEIRPIGTEICEQAAMMIKWLEIHSLLRINYI